MQQSSTNDDTKYRCRYKGCIYVARMLSMREHFAGHTGCYSCRCHQCGQLFVDRGMLEIHLTTCRTYANNVLQPTTTPQQRSNHDYLWNTCVAVATADDVAQSQGHEHIHEGFQPNGYYPNQFWNYPQYQQHYPPQNLPENRQPYLYFPQNNLQGVYRGRGWGRGRRNQNNYQRGGGRRQGHYQAEPVSEAVSEAVKQQPWHPWAHSQQVIDEDFPPYEDGLSTAPPDQSGHTEEDVAAKPQKDASQLDDIPTPPPPPQDAPTPPPPAQESYPSTPQRDTIPSSPPHEDVPPPAQQDAPTPPLEARPAPPREAFLGLRRPSPPPNYGNIVVPPLPPNVRPPPPPVFPSASSQLIVLTTGTHSSSIRGRGASLYGSPSPNESSFSNQSDGISSPTVSEASIGARGSKMSSSEWNRHLLPPRSPPQEQDASRHGASVPPTDPRIAEPMDLSDGSVALSTHPAKPPPAAPHRQVSTSNISQSASQSSSSLAYELMKNYGYSMGEAPAHMDAPRAARLQDIDAQDGRDGSRRIADKPSVQADKSLLGFERPAEPDDRRADPRDRALPTIPSALGLPDSYDREEPCQARSVLQAPRTGSPPCSVMSPTLDRSSDADVRSADGHTCLQAAHPSREAHAQRLDDSQADHYYRQPAANPIRGVETQRSELHQAQDSDASPTSQHSQMQADSPPQASEEQRSEHHRARELPQSAPSATWQTLREAYRSDDSESTPSQDSPTWNDAESSPTDHHHHQQAAYSPQDAVSQLRYEHHPVRDSHNSSHDGSDEYESDSSQDPQDQGAIPSVVVDVDTSTAGSSPTDQYYHQQAAYPPQDAGTQQSEGHLNHHHARERRHSEASALRRSEIFDSDTSQDEPAQRSSSRSHSNRSYQQDSERPQPVYSHPDYSPTGYLPEKEFNEKQARNREFDRQATDKMMYSNEYKYAENIAVWRIKPNGEYERYDLRTTSHEEELRGGSECNMEDRQGLDCSGSSRLGSDRQKSDHQGSHRQGSDHRGSDRQRSGRQGLDRQGSGCQGLDRPGSDGQRLDLQGSDRPGLDRQGSGLQGLDRQGSGCQGLDRPRSDGQRSDLQGSDRPGLDRQGSGLQGLDRQGSGCQGLDRQASDPQGSDHQGPNRQTSDRERSGRQGSDRQRSDRLGSSHCGEWAPGSASRGSSGAARNQMSQGPPAHEELPRANEAVGTPASPDDVESSSADQYRRWQEDQVAESQRLERLKPDRSHRHSEIASAVSPDQYRGDYETYEEHSPSYQEHETPGASLTFEVVAPDDSGFIDHQNASPTHDGHSSDDHYQRIAAQSSYDGARSPAPVSNSAGAYYESSTPDYDEPPPRHDQEHQHASGYHTDSMAYQGSGRSGSGSGTPRNPSSTTAQSSYDRACPPAPVSDSSATYYESSTPDYDEPQPRHDEGQRHASAYPGSSDHGRSGSGTPGAMPSQTPGYQYQDLSAVHSSSYQHHREPSPQPNLARHPSSTTAQSSYDGARPPAPVSNSSATYYESSTPDYDEPPPRHDQEHQHASAYHTDGMAHQGSGRSGAPRNPSFASTRSSYDEARPAPVSTSSAAYYESSPPGDERHASAYPGPDDHGRSGSRTPGAMSSQTLGHQQHPLPAGHSSSYQDRDPSRQPCLGRRSEPPGSHLLAARDAATSQYSSPVTEQRPQPTPAPDGTRQELLGKQPASIQRSARPSDPRPPPAASVVPPKQNDGSSEPRSSTDEPGNATTKKRVSFNLDAAQSPREADPRPKQRPSLDTLTPIIKHPGRASTRVEHVPKPVQVKRQVSSSSQGPPAKKPAPPKKLMDPLDKILAEMTQSRPSSSQVGAPKPVALPVKIPVERPNPMLKPNVITSAKRRPTE